MAMTTIEMEEDVYQRNLDSLVADTPTLSPFARLETLIRRPLRGLQQAADQHATIRVIRDDGTPIPLVNSSRLGRQSTMTGNFILQGLSAPRQEKMQLSETFGQPYAFFFGERGRFINFDVILINSVDFNWRAEWSENYENVFRGTKLVELGARLYFTFDNVTIEGYMTATSEVRQSNNPFHVPVSFTVWVTNYEELSAVGSTSFPAATTLDSTGRAVAASRGLVSDNEDEYLVRDVFSRPSERALASPEDLAKSPEDIYLKSGQAVQSVVGGSQGLGGQFDGALDASGLFPSEELLSLEDVDLMSADSTLSDTTHGIIPLDDTTMPGVAQPPSLGTVGTPEGPDLSSFGVSTFGAV